MTEPNAPAAPPVVVAIDGPVGVGKSSVARAVAEALGFMHLDTGAMYRAVTLLALRGHVDFANEAAVAAIARGLDFHRQGSRIRIGDEDVTDAIRDEHVSANVARVADNMSVRQALVDVQRRLGREVPTVMDGRDIATVVFPDSPLKFYLDATAEERTRRRVSQLRSAGVPFVESEVHRNLVERDRRDASRAWGALRCAPDALRIDTTSLSKDEVVGRIVSIVREHLRSADSSGPGR